MAKEASKKFEIVFISSDQDDASFKEYFADMPWLALPYHERKLAQDFDAVFEIRGIPTLILLKPNGDCITQDGRSMIHYGLEYFPWGPEERERAEAAASEKANQKKIATLRAESEALAEQKSRGGVVLTRIRGGLGSITHDVKEHMVQFGPFSTIGALESITTSGVVYYEVELLECQGIPQFGFALKSFELQDGNCEEGVGDDEISWAVDGSREAAWHGGDKPWNCHWESGDVIGLAANVDVGKIAVSKNGEWCEGALGVVFVNDAIKAGVCPCLTACDFHIKYTFDEAFKYTAPPSELWEAEPYDS